MNIAVITGASSGLGREFTKQISEKYKSIDEFWIMARRMDKLEELAGELNSNGKKVRILCGDVTDKSSLSMYEDMLKKYNPFVRILVNAAGYGKIGHFDELPESENIGMCELNCTALTKMTYITIPYMKGKHADIINMASAAAFMPQPSFAVYAATKSYVLSLSYAIDREMKKDGISVTAVCPGPVSTDFFDIAETYHQSAFYKRMLRANPKRVVEKALRDTYHDSLVSVYGFSMKLFHVASKILPHGFMVKFLK